MKDEHAEPRILNLFDIIINKSPDSRILSVKVRTYEQIGVTAK